MFTFLYIGYRYVLGPDLLVSMHELSSLAFPALLSELHEALYRTFKISPVNTQQMPLVMKYFVIVKVQDLQEAKLDAVLHKNGCFAVSSQFTVDTKQLSRFLTPVVPQTYPCPKLQYIPSFGLVFAKTGSINSGTGV